MRPNPTPKRTNTATSIANALPTPTSITHQASRAGRRTAVPYLYRVGQARFVEESHPSSGANMTARAMRVAARPRHIRLGHGYRHLDNVGDGIEIDLSIRPVQANRIARDANEKDASMLPVPARPRPRWADEQGDRIAGIDNVQTLSARAGHHVPQDGDPD